MRADVGVRPVEMLGLRGHHDRPGRLDAGGFRMTGHSYIRPYPAVVNIAALIFAAFGGAILPMPKLSEGDSTAGYLVSIASTMGSLDFIVACIIFLIAAGLVVHALSTIERDAHRRELLREV